MKLPQLAYEAYRAHTGGISLASGQAIPAWDALKPEIQEAWRASTTSVWVAIANEATSIEEICAQRMDGLAPVQAELVRDYLAARE